MSDQRQDDETVGRALGRAVEGQSVRETPFAGSRLAQRMDRPATRGWTYMLPVAVALALFVAMGAFFAGRGPQGVTTPDAAETPAATSSSSGPPPSPTATPALMLARIYFARDQLPPIGVDRVVQLEPGVRAGDIPADQRVGRLLAALGSKNAPVPTGAIDAFPRSDPAGYHGQRVTVAGDLAMIDFEIRRPDGDWGVRGAAQTQALLQQIVYTATEVPGVRRVRLTQNGRALAIDQLVVDKPLSREDVVGYREPASTQTVRGFGERGGPERRAAKTYSVDGVPGHTTFTIEIAQPAGEPTRMYPDWDVSVAPNDEGLKPNGGKWRLTVQVYNTVDARPAFEVVDRTPLRAITTTTGKGIGAPLIYELALDDLRPWRTALAFDPVRIIVEIGGNPAAISGRNSVTAPAPADVVGREFKVAGIANAFEANVQYRVRDAQGRIVSSGFTTATNCCEAGGLFGVAVRVPTEVPAGRITLEVFQGSPRDGSDLAVISIPLTLR